jgi:hypothetical protein
MIKREDLRCRNGTIMRGKIISSNDITVKMINNNGMYFETSQFINTKSSYKVELINQENEKKKIAGEAISSLLKRARNENGDHIPIYEVCVKFTELNDMERRFLYKLKIELAGNPATS